MRKTPISLSHHQQEVVHLSLWQLNNHQNFYTIPPKEVTTLLDGLVLHHFLPLLRHKKPKEWQKQRHLPFEI